MAYVLFAISALMIAFGVYSLVTGYPVVQVEEGWTAVISGSTFIAGGVVTAALGLVLRMLVQVRDGLLAGRTTAPPPRSDETRAEAADEPEFSPEPAPPVAPLPVLPELAPPPAPDAPKAVERPAAPHSAPPAAAGPYPAVRGDEDWLERALARPPEHHPTPIHDPGPEPEAAPPAPPPEPVAHEPVAPAPLEVPPPPPRETTRLQPELPEAPPVAPDLEPEPEPEPEPAHELQEAVASAKVIGRYEADGTSYVMYADGSIEAQTESGVYRFASMAELKSFIET